MLIRAFVVLTCYVLSSYGIFFSPFVVFGTLDNPVGLSIAVLLWVYAWACHMFMSFSWISNRRVGTVWPVTGTVAGVIMFLLPSFGGFSKAQFAAEFSFSSVFYALAIEVIFVLPCLLLAIFLVHFHIKQGQPPFITQSTTRGES